MYIYLFTPMYIYLFIYTYVYLFIYLLTPMYIYLSDSFIRLKISSRICFLAQAFELLSVDRLQG